MTRNILFSLISIFSLNSQDIEPVEWQYDVNKINDTEYNISFSASILDGWKLYSQFSPDEGALPTSFRFINNCLLYTSPSPRDRQKSRMPSSA